MKKLILLLFVLSINFTFSQTKEILFKAKEKRIILRNDVGKNGDVYIITGNTSKKKLKYFKYDKDFNKLLEVDLKNQSISLDPRYSEIEKTDDGSYIYFEKYDLNFFVDSKGKITEYNIKKKEKSGNVNAIFDFVCNSGQVFIGPQKGRKNHKKKYSSNDIYVFKRNFKDLSTSENVLNQVAIKSNLKKGKAVEWSLGENFNDYFNLLAKDKINKEKNIDTYHVASYGYDGSFKSYAPLTVKLNSGHIILTKFEGPEDFFDNRYGSFSSGKLFTDKKTGEIYIYGYYTDKLRNNWVYGKFNGFYIHKFSPSGELLWSKQMSFKDNIKFKTGKMGYLLQMNHRLLKSEVLLSFSSDKKGLLLYKFDSKTGDLVLSKDVKNYKRLYLDKKQFPKKEFSLDAVFAYAINPEIRQYIKKLDSKKKMYINAFLLEDGGVLLALYDYKLKNKSYYHTVKVLRFDD